MNGTLDRGQVVGGRWRIDRYLASGGFGQVYSATDVSSAAIGAVAVKVLLEGASTAERQSFLTEAVHMSALRHPNLVSHIDSGMLSDAEGAVFLVIDLCDESLDEYRERQPAGTIRPEQLAGLVRNVGAGLEYLHQSGRVHRDLKPGNILRAADRWKLADFGLVRNVSQSGVYHLQNMVGSLRYMAPEFFSDGMVGPAADIWAVGIIVHEVMTGQAAYPGDGPAYIHNVTSGAPNVAPELPRGAAELVRRCLAADPAHRPTAGQLSQILTGDVTARVAPPTDLTPPPDQTPPAGQPPPAGQALPANHALPNQTPPAGQAPPSVPSAEGSVTTGPEAAFTPSAYPPPNVEPPVQQSPQPAPMAAPPGPGVNPVLPPAPIERSSATRRLALLAGVGAVVLLGLAAWALLRNGDTEIAATPVETETETDDDGQTGDGTADDESETTPTDDSSDGTEPSDDGTGEDQPTDAEGTIDDVGEDGFSGDAGGGDEGAVSAGPRSDVALNEFVPNECANVDDVERFVIDTVVVCSDPHFFQVLSIYEAPQAGGDYPGSDALFQLGIARCPQAFLDRFGVDQVDTSLSVLSFAPDEAEWGQQIYSVVCVMYRSDLQPITEPIEDSVDDWLWKPGDSITAVELQNGHCFTAPVPLEIQGFGQRVVFADCEEPHDGQYFESVVLQQPEGGYTDPLEILADGKPLCHDALHELYGDDHRESGFTDTVMVQTPAEYQQAPSNLLLCIVLWDEPTAGTLEDIVAE